MKKILLGLGIFLITVLVIVIFYKRQLGAIPLLLLAVILIYKSLKVLKDND